jgi:hypothetical protein
MKSLLRFLLPVLFLSCAISARGQSTQKGAIVTKPAALGTASEPPPEKTVPQHVPLFETPPVIDGRMDDPAWKGALVLKDFYQVYPGDNVNASRATEVRLGFDSKFLYIGFHAYDEPERVRATVAKRDAIFDDDYVGVFLDTLNDRRKAYELFFNPLGVQQDGILTEGTSEDFSIDIVMESKGAITSDGYTVEVSIPFKSLRYEAGKDKFWGIHLLRRIKRFDNELDSWMPLSRDKSGRLGITGHITEANSGWLDQAGHIYGLENLWQGHALELIPSLTLSETGERKRAIPHAAVLLDPTLQDPGRFVNAPVSADPGLTAKYLVSPSVTLDATINPDFAQVEADATVVTANQRFPIFFEEKRPFFLEGKEIFETPLTPLHTRAIVDPDYAVKLTGKLGRNTFGLLVASDNAPGNFSQDELDDPVTGPGIRRFAGKNAFVGVLRLKRDVGQDSNLGFIATSYNFIEKHNQLAGFDGRLRLGPQTLFSFQVLGTTSRRFFRDADLGSNVYRTGNGFGYYFNYGKTGRGLTYRLRGEGRTRDYRADVGFTRRTNTNQETLVVRYNSPSHPEAKVISWSIQKQSFVSFDWQGRLQRVETYPNVSFNFKRQSFLTLYGLLGSERLFEEEFGPKRTATRAGAFAGPLSERRAPYWGVEVEAQTQPSRKYQFYLDTYYKGGAFDFDFGSPPKFPRVSPAALLDPSAPLDPGPGDQLFVNTSVTYQPTTALRASLEYTKSRLVRRDTGLTAFDENIYALRATYQFTRFTFARARIDYDTLISNVRGQFLVGWAPNPGTSFYAGYNNDLNRNGFNPFTQQFEPGLTRNGQTFFIKMSYLFRRSL